MQYVALVGHHSWEVAKSPHSHILVVAAPEQPPVLTSADFTARPQNEGTQPVSILILNCDAPSDYSKECRHVDNMQDNTSRLYQAPDMRLRVIPEMQFPAAVDSYTPPETVGCSATPGVGSSLLTRPYNVSTELVASHAPGAPELEKTLCTPPGDEYMSGPYIYRTPSCHSSQSHGFHRLVGAPDLFRAPPSEHIGNEYSQLSVGPSLGFGTAVEFLPAPTMASADPLHCDPSQSSLRISGEVQFNELAQIDGRLSHTPPSQPLPAPYSHQAVTLSASNITDVMMSSPISYDGAATLESSHPDWRLTPEAYEWLFAVMYPKRRPNKKIPTPSGPCLFCGSICKRPGILQQHLTVIHRQRLARKHLAGQPYNVGLALAFVVAELRCSAKAQSNAALQECRAFLGALRANPAGLESPGPDMYLWLRQKLDEFCGLQSWVGVQCRKCGMWATRPAALEEHQRICAAARPPEQAPVPPRATIVPNQPLRLTASGLAARPIRGNIHAL